jgi:hypothetical protein
MSRLNTNTGARGCMLIARYRIISSSCAASCVSWHVTFSIIQPWSVRHGAARDGTHMKRMACDLPNHTAVVSVARFNSAATKRAMGHISTTTLLALTGSTSYRASDIFVVAAVACMACASSVPPPPSLSAAEQDAGMPWIRRVRRHL